MHTKRGRRVKWIIMDALPVCGFNFEDAVYFVA